MVRLCILKKAAFRRLLSEPAVPVILQCSLALVGSRTQAVSPPVTLVTPCMALSRGGAPVRSRGWQEEIARASANRAHPLSRPYTSRLSSHIFIPKKQVYKKLVEEKGKSFEIVYVPATVPGRPPEDDKSFKELLAMMPWLAVPLHRKAVHKKLTRRFQVRGLACVGPPAFLLSRHPAAPLAPTNSGR